MSEDFFKRIGTEVDKNKLVGALMAVAPKDVPPQGKSNTPSLGEITDRRWSQSDNLFWGAPQTVKTLEPGFYNLDHRDIGPCLLRSKVEVDDLLELPDASTTEVLAEFAEFWRLKSRFEEHGFLHKRGILLWGPPGSGKTSSLMLMARNLIHTGGIVCKVHHAGLGAKCLEMIRKIEPDRPIVAFLEDIDAMVSHQGETELLALLDGETQINGIVYIATTNYPERLDRRLVDRPSRFDTIRYIGMPTAAARDAYLQVKAPSLTANERADWVKVTDGFSVAHLRELVILVCCFGNSLSSAVARLESMRVSKPNSADSPDKMPFGFGV